MRKHVIALVVALTALTVGASTVTAQPTAVAAKKKCKKTNKRKPNGKFKKKCWKVPVPPVVVPGPAGQNGANGTPGQPGDPGNPGDPGTPGQPAQTKITSLNGDPFSASNDSVAIIPDGVHFGPYADSGACDPDGASYGSLVYDGLNGHRLQDVLSLVYNARYTADDDTGGVGVPYLRIFTDAVGPHDAIFSPNTQPDADVAQGPFHTWVATSGLWRYDDDGGSGGQYGLSGAPFSTVKADHGEEIITSIKITTGCSAGHNLDALLRSWQINNTNYSFGA